MKIVENIPNRLTLRSYQPEPAFLIIAAGVGLILIGVLQPKPGPDVPNRMELELMSILFRGLLIAMGSFSSVVALVWVELVKRYTFDRDRNLFTVVKRYCLRSSTTQYRLDRIHKVAAGPYEDSDGDTHDTIRLVLDTGRTVYVSDVTQSGDRAEYAHQAKAIATFLKLVD